MKQKLKKFGIFGGSFNPIHHGHLIVARKVLENMNWDRILFIPNKQSPFKDIKTLASDVHRLNMLKIAIKDENGFEISEIEILRKGISYTIDTVRDLKDSFPEISFHLMMGSDSLQTLNSWHEFDKLRKTIPMVVMARPGFSSSNNTYQFPVISGPHIDISASDIRERISLGKSIKYLVPESVRLYINKNNVYKKRTSLN